MFISNRSETRWGSPLIDWHIVSCPAKGEQNQMKLIPQTKWNERKEIKGKETALPLPLPKNKSADMIWNYLSTANTIFNNFPNISFRFHFGRRLVWLRVPQKSESQWGKVSFGFHFALQVASCRMPQARGLGSQNSSLRNEGHAMTTIAGRRNFLISDCLQMFY